MKESVGGIQLFIIVITMILLFAGIMSFTINRSNAFAIKDKIINIIETSGGLDLSEEVIGTEKITDEKAIMKIVDVISENNYRTTGKCDEKEQGYTRTGAITNNANESVLCILKTNSNNGKFYYKIKVFYSLDLPVINSIFTFKSIGQTKILDK